MVVNDIRISQKLKDKGLLSMEKVIRKCEKITVQGLFIRFQFFSCKNRQGNQGFSF